jgi:RNA polymerase sigma factor (sigma-70 family)
MLLEIRTFITNVRGQFDFSVTIPRRAQCTNPYPGRLFVLVFVQIASNEGVIRRPTSFTYQLVIGNISRVQTTVNDDGVSVFESVRPRLFGIAYRMLGSAAEAEDIVQDTWLRWQGTDRNAVVDPPAFLATATTRLAITFSQSARSRRETYIGPWLPEPIDTSGDPRLGAERAEALEFAVLLLLEKLSPTERAAYILREAFDYSYDQIAHILRSSEANARQLVTRARKHISDGRRKAVGSSEQKRLLNAFIVASQKGDLPTLERLFASDVVSYADGGGALHVSRRPVLGRARVANYYASVGSFMGTGVTIEWIETNGQAGALVLRNGAAVGLATIEASEEGIFRVLLMMRPSKLVTISRSAEARRMSRSGLQTPAP